MAPSAVTISKKSHGQLRRMEAKQLWGYMEPWSHGAREQTREGGDGACEMIMVWSEGEKVFGYSMLC